MKIVGTGTIVERVLSEFFSAKELRELEQIQKNDLMDLVMEYGGEEVFEEANSVIFEEDDFDEVQPRAEGGYASHL